MSYLDEFYSKFLLANFKIGNNKRLNIIGGIILGLAFLLLVFGLVYAWYTRNYMPSNYGVKTIGIVYNRVSGRKSAMNAHLYYKVKGITYSVMGEVNSYEDAKNTKIEIGDTFCVMYYPKEPSWSNIDFFMEIPDSLKAKKTSIVTDSNTLFLDLEVQDEKNERLLNDF